VEKYALPHIRRFAVIFVLQPGESFFFVPYHTLSSELLRLFVSCVGANCVLLQIQEMRSTMVIVLVKTCQCHLDYSAWIAVLGLLC